MNKPRLILLTGLVASVSLLSACDSNKDAAETEQPSVLNKQLPDPIRHDTMIATARKGVPLNQEALPAPIPRVVDTDLRQSRNYPMQPPLIPHDIRGYEVNLEANRCMACHARGEVKDTQAPMISVTHYMDRSGNFLAEISPRRYFCNQCHVVQTATVDLVDNSFEDMGILIKKRLDQQEN